MTNEIELGVSDFVALCNQTLSYAFDNVTVTGELANLRVSKGKWLYFDLKDDGASVKFFGTVYQLPGPLEDGMVLRVRGNPRLHNMYGFSINVTSIQTAGEGSIKRAAELLQAKLTAEGLFNDDRKRIIPYPPRRIGLVTSRQSAAYADFIKIITARWRGLELQLIDVQVQGEVAPAQIVNALTQFNSESTPPDVLIVIRGGGSPEDLAAFNNEAVVRAVAASRIPTLVAIGHENDVSLAELAADKRGSTPSNAAELLVPDRQQILLALPEVSARLHHMIGQCIATTARELAAMKEQLFVFTTNRIKLAQHDLSRQKLLLIALSPRSILERGYAIVRQNNLSVGDTKLLATNAIVDVELARGMFQARITQIEHVKERHGKD